jgi:hypothetical protein
VELWIPVGEEIKMTEILRIEGRANKVFDIIKNISQTHSNMTLEEVGQKGLLKHKLQHTIPYEPGKFPEVWLNSETANN